MKIRPTLEPVAGLVQTVRVQLETWRSGGRFFRWSGHEIFFRAEGQGEVLLCIHGFPTASWDWHAVWPALAQRFRLVAADLLGFGFSSKPRRFPYSILRQADLLETLCRQLGIGSVHILAHDYGDTVAQELLARQRERPGSAELLGIRSVCFLNGGLFPEVHRARFIQKVLASPIGPLAVRLLTEKQFRRSFSAIFGADTQPSESQLAEFWTLVSANQGRRVIPSLLGYLEERRLHASRWTGAVTDSPVPVRFVNGLQDPVSGAHMVKRFRELVPRADVVELPQSGHYPQLESPQEVCHAVLSFVP